MSVFPQLSQRWHVYAFDLRGHGLSGRPADLEGYNLRYHVADTIALLRDVVREPAVLMGHSYGAVIAALTGMPAAAWLRGIVLEDPPLHLRRDNQESKLDYFKMIYELVQTAHTVDEIMAGAIRAESGCIHRIPSSFCPEPGQGGSQSPHRHHLRQ